MGQEERAKNVKKETAAMQPSTNYRTFQKECKRHLRKAEWDYVSTNIIDGLNNNNIKPFWKYVKSKRQEAGEPLKKGTNLISDSKGKAELLLNQFKSVFTKPTNNALPSTRIQSKTTSDKSSLIKRA